MADRKKRPRRALVGDQAPSVRPRALKEPQPLTEDGQPGRIFDFISGVTVAAKREETEAVQVFARRLVEDLGYPKTHITTRPQFRVRKRPSDESRSQGYPVDIAVFRSAKKIDDEAFILVECKKPERVDGEKQLKLYLTMSSAQIGVWFNGRDHLYLYKKYLPNGSIEWKTLPSIPRFGQGIGDIGQLRRSELTVPKQLRTVFRDIRHRLAGNTTGMTRDQELAQEIMSVLFCKIYDELDCEPDDLPRFRTGADEPASKVAKRIRDLFQAVKRDYRDVFRASDEIELDSDSLQYVVGELQNYALTEATRDVIGEAFEVFIGPAVRGEEGQFFTPRNVVQMIVSLLDVKPGELIVDPACGSGGFLIVALEHIWARLEQDAKRKKWSAQQLERKKREAAMQCIRGLDKDKFLTRLTKAYMAIIGDGRGGIFCEDSLAEPERWEDDTSHAIKLGGFDVVLTNPPFGSKIEVTGPSKLRQYTLARKWKKPRSSESGWEATEQWHDAHPPQILFIERCIQLLRPGGRLAIVLPESIFGMPVYGYIVQWLYENYRLRGFISLPEEVFQPSTHAKTCVVLLENRPPRENDEIEMAIADWCGHDSRGNPTIRLTPAGEEVLLDDLPKIAEHLRTRLVWDT
jgi:type I restriction enzyme M protein